MNKQGQIILAINLNLIRMSNILSFMDCFITVQNFMSIAVNLIDYFFGQRYKRVELIVF